MKKPASMSTIRHVPEEADAPGDESAVRMLNTKNVRQLSTKRQLSDRLFRELHEDDEGEGPLAAFDHCYFDDEIASPSDALAVADKMLEHLVSHVFSVIHGHSAVNPEGKRYSYRRFLRRDAEGVAQLLSESAHKLLIFDMQEFNKDDAINTLLYIVLTSAMACDQNIRSARDKLKNGLPVFMNLIGIGRGLESVANSVRDLRDDGLFQVVASSKDRANHGKKGAKARPNKVTAETVRAAQQRLIAAKMNPRNIISKLAAELRVSRPTIEKYLKEK